MDRLLDMLEVFVAGGNRSREYVGDIENLLTEELRDSAVFEDLTVPVASYRPEGGDFLYDQDALSRVFRNVLKEAGRGKD